MNTTYALEDVKSKNGSKKVRIVGRRVLSALSALKEIQYSLHTYTYIFLSASCTLNYSTLENLYLFPEEFLQESMYTTAVTYLMRIRRVSKLG